VDYSWVTLPIVKDRRLLRGPQDSYGQLHELHMNQDGVIR
jgi:hypothetical protein